MGTQHERVDTDFLFTLAFNEQFDQLARHLLQNSEQAVRMQAAELLAEYSETMDDEEREPIRAALIAAVQQEPSDAVRARTIEALSEFGESAIDDLVDSLGDPERPTPAEEPYPNYLLRWFDSDYSEFRLVAVAAIARLDSHDGVPKLAAACSDLDPRVRLRAVTECGRVGDDRCVRAVATHLTSDADELRHAAADALQRIGSRKAIRALLPAAKSDDTDLRRTAIGSLGEVGSLNLLGTLLRGLDDDDPTIRAAAAESIIELVAAAPSEESHTVRETVAKQLNTFPDRDIVPVFLSLFEETDRPKIRRNTAWLLGRIADEGPRTDVIHALIKAIADDDAETTRVATASLVRIDDPAIIDELERFIKATDLDSKALNRADFIRSRLTDSEAEARLKDAVEYTEVSDPADYTRKQAEKDSR